MSNQTLYPIIGILVIIVIFLVAILRLHSRWLSDERKKVDELRAEAVRRDARHEAALTEQRRQMASLDTRNEVLAEATRDGQKALIVALTQLATVREQLAILAPEPEPEEPVEDLPEVEDVPDTATPIYDAAGVFAAIEVNRAHPENRQPRVPRPRKAGAPKAS